MPSLPKVTRLLAICALVAGCTPPLSQDTADEFSSLATAAASFVGAPAELQKAALTDAGKNRRMCSYLSGGSYDLGANASITRVSRLALQQAGAGRQLKTYVESLVEASRGGSVEKLEEAKSGFAGGLSELLTAAGVSEAAAAGPLVELVVKAGEGRRQARIREIMKDAIEPLFILRDLLNQDVTQVASETEAAVRKWDASAKCVLRHSRRGADPIGTFEAYDTRRSEYEKLLAAVSNAPKAVENLYIAHLLAVQNPDDFQSSIDDIVFVLQQIDGIKSAFEQ